MNPDIDLASIDRFAVQQAIRVNRIERMLLLLFVLQFITSSVITIHLIWGT